MDLGRQPDASRLWISPEALSLREAIFCTLSYADVFNYPLTLSELHRYLIGIQITPEALAAALRGMSEIPRTGDYYTLPGRASLVALRQRREEIARALWPHALRYGRRIAGLPFVRMVALSGALAVNNVEAGDDLDYLIVTVARRVWLTRLLIVQFIVKPAAQRDQEVCPNFLLAEHALTLAAHDLFHAHELVQMVPLYGLDVYEGFRDRNAWTSVFLPNASGPPRVEIVRRNRSRAGRALLEAPLQNPLGNWVESREVIRMQQKLQALPGSNDSEVALSPDQCKGHVHSHAHLTRSAFFARLNELQKQE